MSAPGPESRGCLADEVAQRITDAVVLGDFPPGTRLDEHMLAARFEVSRTPVREALKQLAQTGLIAARPHRGAVVAVLTPQELDQLFEAIGELEAACARHAALRMTEPEREHLRALHLQSRDAVQAGDAERYDALNSQLHLVILHGAHNAVLTDMALALRQRAAPLRRAQFRNLERTAESFAEHSEIVEALVARDGVSAYRQMRAHLNAARHGVGRVSPAWTAAAAAAY